MACCTDNDGDGYYAEGGFCGEMDCDDEDSNTGPCDFFWMLSIEGAGDFNGNGAFHNFPGEATPSFFLTLNHLDEPNEGLGNVQALDGPGRGETGSWGATFSFQYEDRAWTAADGSDETSATLVITKNTTSELEGTVSGIAATMEGTELALRLFTLDFRSDHGAYGLSLFVDR